MIWEGTIFPYMWAIATSAMYHPYIYIYGVYIYYPLINIPTLLPGF